jgi:hypothetical protein
LAVFSLSLFAQNQQRKGACADKELLLSAHKSATVISVGYRRQFKRSQRFGNASRTVQLPNPLFAALQRFEQLQRRQRYFQIKVSYKGIGS